MAVPTWPKTRVLLACLAGVLVSSALLVWPLFRAAGLAQAPAEQAGIAALSFSIASVVTRLAIVIVPPIVFFVVWSVRRS